MKNNTKKAILFLFFSFAFSFSIKTFAQEGVLEQLREKNQIDSERALHNQALRKEIINAFKGADNNAKLHKYLAYDEELNSNHSKPLGQDQLVLYSALCLQEAARLEQSLIPIITELYHDLDYWQHQKDHPTHYFISKGPIKWITGPSQEDEINENIEQLNKEIVWYTHYLGYIHELIEKLESQPSRITLEKQLCKTVEIMYACINFELIDTEKFYYSCTKRNLSSLLADLPEQISQFDQDAQESIYYLRRPNHFTRNWLKYAIGAATAYGLYSYYTNNATKIWDTTEQIKIAADRAYEERFVEPLNEIKEILLNGKENKIFNEKLNVIGDLATDKKALGDSFRDTMRAYNEHLDKKEKLSEEKINYYAENILTDPKAYQLISDAYVKQKQNPVWNVPRGKLVGLGLLRAEHMIISFLERANKKLDDTIEKTQKEMQHSVDLNQQLLKALPITILGGITAYIGYKATCLGYHLTKKVIAPNTFSFRPLQKALITIERILNVHDTSRALSYSAAGQVVYWIDNLTQYMPFVPKGDRAVFTKDLNELSSSLLSPEQKLRTIDRMYRAYPFLWPKTP